MHDRAIITFVIVYRSAQGCARLLHLMLGQCAIRDCDPLCRRRLIIEFERNDPFVVQGLGADEINTRLAELRIRQFHTRLRGFELCKKLID